MAEERELAIVLADLHGARVLLVAMVGYADAAEGAAEAAVRDVGELARRCKALAKWRDVDGEPTNDERIASGYLDSAQGGALRARGEAERARLLVAGVEKLVPDERAEVQS
jgi:hypothetical protein